MHRHRIAAFLAGCLILGDLFMIFVATQNFATVDRVLAAPQSQPAAQMFQKLGPEDARLLLRYLAGEENRLFFTSWEWAQIALGLLLTALLLSVRSLLLAGLGGTMLIIALFQRFRVTPEMIELGRLVDFGGGAGSAAYSQFWRLHGLYGALEVAKLALLVVLAGILLFGRRGKTPEPVEADPVVAAALAEP